MSRDAVVPTVLLVHNRYRERGGEDSVYEAEARLLERFGHRVLRYERDNREIADMGAGPLALRTVWSPRDRREVADIVRQERVDVAHFHNTLPLISPAALYGARAAGAAVVQTLHNFRLLCPAGLFLRNNAACEKCLGRAVPWPAMAHRCYRSSFAASGVLTGMLTVHRALRTWQRQVDAFIVLSRFARERFIAGGLPAERLVLGGGVVEIDDQTTAAPPEPGSHFLYVGRLATEKGMAVLLRAWESVPDDIRLHIIGDGPLREHVTRAAGRDSRIRWLGSLPREAVLNEMQRAYALVFPSLCYENSPSVLAEAQAMALPVIASRQGSGAEIVQDGGFGTLFEPGDALGLAAAVLRLAQSPPERAVLSRLARARYEELLTPERCYDRLLRTYEGALARRHAAGPHLEPSLIPAEP
jgi:glycosyltransferase involved in cell wall biosynthesis